MYSLSQLQRGLATPALFFREANRLWYRRFNRRAYNTTGVDIFAEDWDNLVILDACRYDMFEQQNTISGTLESRRSRGASTTEFLKANFSDRNLEDTVYVTANPQLYRNESEIRPQLHAVENVWQDDGWDTENKTVLPETVTRYAQDAADRFPNKRLIVHYIQPHYPFIGSETMFDKGHLDDPNETGDNVWTQLITGEIDMSREQIWNLYIDNLDRALPAVSELAEHLQGRTVITADHGNMVGERAFPFPIREWGHPRGIYTEELVKVPWLVIEGAERRKIEAEQPQQSNEGDVDSNVVADRLEHLGYTE